MDGAFNWHWKNVRRIFVLLKSLKQKGENMVSEEQKKEYQDYVKEITPTHNTPRNIFRAFWTGGTVCVIGQILSVFFEKMGMGKEAAGTWTSIALVLAAIILTGLHLFGKLTKYAGAGLLVPITGFANSVAAPAIEYKAEGEVFGIGCKIFTIAGPVILYGIFSSWIAGLLYLLAKLWM